MRYLEVLLSTSFISIIAASQFQTWIGQTTPICGANNTLTVTILPNTSVLSSVPLTITGLVGTNTPSSTFCFPLTGTNASLFDLNGARGCGKWISLFDLSHAPDNICTGSWNRTAGNLIVVSTTATIPARSIIIFSFVLQNSFTARAAASVLIVIGSAVSQPIVDNSVYLTIAGGREPLLAVLAQVTAVSTSQTSMYAAVPNNITVSMTLSVGLPRYKASDRSSV